MMDDSFGARLRFIRKQKNVTVNKISKATGIHENALQNYEYGKHKPGFYALITLADYYGVSLDYLMKGSESDSDSGNFRFLNDIIAERDYYKKLLEEITQKSRCMILIIQKALNKNH